MFFGTIGIMKNFTPVYVKTNSVEFVLFQRPGSRIFTTAVTAPVEFLIDFELVNGEFVKKSDNPDFYDNLIRSVEAVLPAYVAHS